MAAAVLVPASAEAVLVIEDASGVRALLEKAGSYAPSIAPQPVGATLRERTGVDLLAEQPAWGLARRGPRLLVFGPGATGLIAPVRDRKAARAMLASWLGQDRRRAGRLSGTSLLTASGSGARALLQAMGRRTPLPRELQPHARGALWMWARLAAPLRATVLAIEAGAAGLMARGLVTASATLLEGSAPTGCESGIACVRAGVGEAGRELIAGTLRALGGAVQPGLSEAARVEERVTGIDPRQLSDQGSLGRALRIAPAFGGAESAAALEGQADLAEIDAALASMTPLDALRGPLAAGAYAAHLLYGRLLRNAGPLSVTGRPGDGNAAAIEIRLPMR